MLILDKLWNGELDPAGRPVRRIPDYSRRQGEVVRVEEQLLELLSPDGQARLEEFDSAWASLSAALEQDAFCTGFRTAGLLILDILLGAETN